MASYRQTTLTAFQQVEDNLAALRVLAQETDQQQHAVASAQESLELSTNRYKGGVDTYLQVITVQTLALANERNAVDILRRRMDASVLLIKAIGGGWHGSNVPPLAKSIAAAGQFFGRDWNGWKPALLWRLSPVPGWIRMLTAGARSCSAAWRAQAMGL